MIGSVVARLVMAGVAATAVFGLGVKVGGTMAASEWKSRIINEAENATQVLDRKTGELEQCRGQVDKINVTVAEQGRKLTKQINADSKRRKLAAEEAEQRDTDSRERLDRVFLALEDLRIGIENGTFDECVGADADPEFIRLLNEALAAGSDSEGRDSDLPAAGAED